MSIYSNPVIDTIPWKIFVKSSNEKEPETSTKQFINILNFSGNEARSTYEEIIKENEDKKVSKSVKSFKQNVNKLCTKTTKPTVNAIMKAVEQRDITFLKNHIQAENVNNTDNFGWTPLMLAAYCGFIEIVDFLLKSGANKRFREKSGLTAAQLALKKNFLDIVALLRKNSSISCDNNVINIDELNINKNEDTHKNEEGEIKTKIYCDVCKDEFMSHRHENSILHIFNSKPKLPNAFFGISKYNKGYQMLLSSGWDEESGLGKEGKGKKYPVKTVLKLDRKGLGQTTKLEPKITHFKPADVNAIMTTKPKIYQTKVHTKKDREKLLSRDARKERVLRIALS